jgi:hypothetical protein
LAGSPAVSVSRERPSLRARLVCAFLIAMATGAFTYSTLTDLGDARLRSGSTIMANDFTQSWLAARAVLRGIDPYEFVLSQPTPSGTGWFYPYPAALIALPFGWIPVQLAGAAFIAVGCGLLAFFVSREGLWRLSLFLTAPAMRLTQSVQWSPLLLAGAVWPGMLGVVVAKPNLAAAFFAYQTNLRDVLRGLIGGALLVLVSLMLAPSWPMDWIHTLRGDASVSQYQSPILTLLGWPVALAALRWRRREARLLLLMACLPQNGFFYDQLPLMLVPAHLVEVVLVAGISHLGHALAIATKVPDADVATWSSSYFPIMVATLYLPCLFLVLRRPNEGPMPPWIERRVAALPTWLRGRASIVTLPDIAQTTAGR